MVKTVHFMELEGSLPCLQQPFPRCYFYLMIQSTSYFITVQCDPVIYVCTGVLSGLISAGYPTKSLYTTLTSHTSATCPTYRAAAYKAF